MRPGCVYLVGAGPGDASLLTLRAAELLAEADVVVHDRLVGDDILNLIASHAERVDVGKRPGFHPVPQEQIHEILVSRALAGKRVLRLKGGDPYVFGRGGEEAQVLLARGIPVEVVPGVSSAIAALARFGIPVTHRDHCTAFHVATGHRREDLRDKTLDFPALAASQGTLVFLMGLANLEENCRALIEHGKDPQTPAAVISRAYTLEECMVTGVLETISALARARQVQSPAILVVGSVVRLTDALQVRAGGPLRGARVLIPRARGQSGRFARLVRDRGGIPLEIPLIRVVPRWPGEKSEEILSRAEDFQWIVFTSENAVSHFFESCLHYQADLRRWWNSRVVSIGRTTSAALRARGFFPDSEAADSGTPGLLDLLRGKLRRGERVLLPRSARADQKLPRTLVEWGCDVAEWPLYDTEAVEENFAKVRDWLNKNLVDWIALTSSSMAEALADACNVGSLSAKIACIGPATRAAALARGLPVHVTAPEASVESLLEVICQNASGILSS